MTSMLASIRALAGLALLCSPAAAGKVAELPTFAGPAMGTTYRVTLAGPVAGHSVGELHRGIDRLLGRLDEQLSTWRDDSDASRFNAADAHSWVDVGDDLARVMQIAEDIHEKTGGRFDVTVAPLVRWWKRQPTAAGLRQSRRPPAPVLSAVGLDLIAIRPASTTKPAAMRKQNREVEITLAAIGPGYAVDRIGECLLDLGSRGHLVELGGEVRAWGRQPDGTAWTVAVPGPASGSGQRRLVQLADGEAIAVAQPVATRPVIDPRTGCLAPPAFDGAMIIRASSCAEADALATATMIPD